jgi:hypothetical protein
MGDKYTHMDELTLFAFLANAMGGGGDRGQSFPRSDAEDLSRGARFIPGEVTLARRRGEIVTFEQPCDYSSCCWYWQFQDGSRSYHWNCLDFVNVARANGVELKADEYGTLHGDPGPCPACGNPHMSGERVEYSETQDVDSRQQEAAQ